MTDINIKQGTGTYWTSILLMGGIFALIGTVLSIVMGYVQINSEPSGSFFGPQAIGGVVLCLFTAFTGLAVIWHYTTEVTRSVTMGQGALIGFLTGAVISLFSTVFSQIWGLIDPEYTMKVVESMVANMEMMGLPDEAMDAALDQAMEAETFVGILKSLLFAIPISGILNLLTALIGVKIFAETPQDVL